MKEEFDAFIAGLDAEVLSARGQFGVGGGGRIAEDEAGGNDGRGCLGDEVGGNDGEGCNGDKVVIIWRKCFRLLDQR